MIRLKLSTAGGIVSLVLGAFGVMVLVAAAYYVVRSSLQAKATEVWRGLAQAYQAEHQQCHERLTLVEAKLDVAEAKLEVLEAHEHGA